jgi:hypothetical protein
MGHWHAVTGRLLKTRIMQLNEQPRDVTLPAMTDPLVASEAGLTGDQVMAQRNAFRNSFAADKWCEHTLSHSPPTV